MPPVISLNLDMKIDSESEKRKQLSTHLWFPSIPAPCVSKKVKHNRKTVSESRSLESSMLNERVDYLVSSHKCLFVLHVLCAKIKCVLPNY